MIHINIDKNIKIIIVDFSSDGLHSTSCGLSLWQYQDG